MIPFFTVLLAEATARGVGYLLAEAGVTINGQSGGILPVLVFGAGTDYALLLVVALPRGAAPPRGQARGDARSRCRRAGPAILASGLTVIVALLTLSLAEVNGTAGLGPIGAMGVALAMISMLTHAARAARDLRAQGVLAPFFDTIPHVGAAGHRRDARPLAAASASGSRRARGASGSPARSCSLVLAADVTQTSTPG